MVASGECGCGQFCFSLFPGKPEAQFVLQEPQEGYVAGLVSAVDEPKRRFGWCPARARLLP